MTAEEIVDLIAAEAVKKYADCIKQYTSPVMTVRSSTGLAELTIFLQIGIFIPRNTQNPDPVG